MGDHFLIHRLHVLEVSPARAQPKLSPSANGSALLWEMAFQPCKFDDLGKEASDLLNKNYLFGTVKLEAKAKSSGGVEFTTGGSHFTDTGTVHGFLETKYKYSDYGVTFTEKWNTDNVLATEITIEDQLTKGLKLSFDTTFSPASGKKTAKVKTGYKRDYLHATTDFDFDFAGPTVHGSAVAGYNGWMAGCQASYDTGNSKLAANNLALGYKGKDFVIHSSVSDGSKFKGAVHNKVNDKLECAAQLGWTSGESATKLVLGAKYDLDGESSFKAKVNNNLQLGLSFIHNLRPGVKLTLSGLVDTKNLDQPGHKLGLGLDLNA